MGELTSTYVVPFIGKLESGLSFSDFLCLLFFYGLTTSTEEYRVTMVN